MPDPTEINKMMEFFKHEDDESFEAMKIESLSDEKYQLDDSIFDEPAYLRVLNASPGSPRLDVIFQKDKSVNVALAKKLSYSRLTDYKKVYEGLGKIYIYIDGRNDPIAVFKINLPESGYYTLMICGSIHNLRPVLSVDRISSKSSDKASVRLINLSPCSDSVDLLLNNTKVFENIVENSISGYVEIEPDIYNLKLLYSGTDDILLSGRNVILCNNKAYTIYILGFIQGYPKLAFAVSIDEAVAPEGK